MDTIIAIQGKGFVLFAASRTVVRSVVVMKQDYDRVLRLDDHKLMAFAGESGDSVQFCEFIQRNTQLYVYRNGLQLSTKATASFTRNELATALRKNPYNVNLLLGGFDEADGASLYFIDYLSSMHKVRHGAHGYAGYFVSSVLDRYYTPDLTLEDALAIIDKCKDELSQRFIVNSIGDFTIKVVTAEGIRQISPA